MGAKTRCCMYFYELCPIRVITNKINYSMSAHTQAIWLKACVFGDYLSNYSYCISYIYHLPVHHNYNLYLAKTLVFASGLVCWFIFLKAGSRFCRTWHQYIRFYRTLPCSLLFYWSAYLCCYISVLPSFPNESRS